MSTTIGTRSSIFTMFCVSGSTTIVNGSVRPVRTSTSASARCSGSATRTTVTSTEVASSGTVTRARRPSTSSEPAVVVHASSPSYGGRIVATNSTTVPASTAPVAGVTLIS